MKKVSKFLIVIFALTNIFLMNFSNANAATKEDEKINISSGKNINMGTIAHYNGVIFGDQYADNADTEGALAVGGNSILTKSNFSYGSNFEYHLGVQIGDEITDGIDVALLLGGSMKSEVNAVGHIVKPGIAVITESNKDNNIKYLEGDIKYLKDSEVTSQFDKFKSETKNLQSTLKGYTTDNYNISTINTFGTQIKFGEATKNNNVLVSQNNIDYFNEINLPDLSKYETVIIRSTASNIVFGPGGVFYKNTQVGILPNNDVLKELASKIIWDFPNAKTITNKGAGVVVGSVIAPNAVVDFTSGNINGQLIAQELHQKGGFELHNFYYHIPEEKNEGSVILTKEDSMTENPLKGAEFSLQDKNGNDIKTGLTTNNKGQIEVKDLAPGNYQFVETKAPEGYELDKTPVKFEIKADSKSPIKVIKYDELIKGSVILTKEDEFDKSPLKGAEFTLQDKNGNDIKTGLTTNDKGQIEVKDLAPGEYQFVETKAPKGYIIDKIPVKFTIEVGQTKVKSLIKYNKEVPTPPVDPVIPPVDPVDPIEPINPVVPPVKPVDPIEPINPVLPPVNTITPPVDSNDKNENKELPSTGYTENVGMEILGVLLIFIAVILLIKGHKNRNFNR